MTEPVPSGFTPSFPFLAQLWAAAEKALGDFFQFYGYSHEFRRREPQTRARLWFLRRWLKPLEELVSRALLLEAHKLARENPLKPRAQTQPRTPPAQPVQREPQPRRDTGEWRVTFHVRGIGPKFFRRPSARLLHYRGATHSAGRSVLTPPARLAARWEALRRTIQDPSATIKRLARNFRRDPHLASRVKRAPKNLPVLQTHIAELNLHLDRSFKIGPRIRRLE